MDSEQLLNLEERIRNSQSLVVPSDTLRGRVVSEILQRQSGQVFAGKLYRFCCIALICNACILMSVRSMDRWWNDHYQPVSSSELLCRAQQIQDSSHMEPAESLAEAYHQWKLQLASQWKNAAQE